MALLRVACFALLILLASSPARGDEVVQKSFETQLFWPALGLDTYFTVEGPSVPNHLAFTLGLTLNYQHQPLVVYVQATPGTASEGIDLDRAKAIKVVDHQFTADLVGAVGLHFKWLHAQIGLNLPINLALTGTDVNETGDEVGDLSATNIGDLKMQIKATILRDLAGFSLSFSPIITFPTGNDDGFGGDPNLSVIPRLVAGYRYKDLSLAANIGYLIREDTVLFSSEIGDQLMYGVAAGYQVHKRILLLAELFGRAGFGTESGCRWDSVTRARICTGTSSTDLDAFPLELDLGARVGLTRGFDITAGLGFGLIRAIGSPAVRASVGVRWAPDFRDTDDDGIYDYLDKCPTQPEDKDGFKDEDGCPDPDNDGDLIPDVRDKCPNEPEDKDTHQDEDGCPDPDNDGDGINDIKDACPFKAETKNGYKDFDGCPDIPDMDGDGIADKLDKCPKEAEDRDNFQDEDGCPDPDNDNDEVPDQFDDCPNDAEDQDKFQDDDGCPDPDNDKDGVMDAEDKCPNEPETINGIKDDDGCPDKGKTHVFIKENKIVITRKVYFRTAKATIQKRSHGILGEVALILNVHKNIKGVRIEGHTDSRGNDAKNKELSQQRAESVLNYLVSKGVSAGRLFAVGYGEEKPIANNKTRGGRAKNRRVEFVILDAAPGAAKKK